MRKTVALTLAGIVLLSVFFLSPVASRADVDKCFDDWERCRERAYEAKVGVIKMTIMLTMCDIAHSVCIIANAL